MIGTMHNVFKYLLIPFLLLLSSCRQEPLEPVEPVIPGGPGWTTLHIRATVSQGTDTKATLDERDIHYVFERDDLLYVVDKASYDVTSTSAENNANAPRLYGFLYLISGAEATTAVFEGDLMYFDPTSHEPGEPAANFPITATLVSQSQETGSIFNCANGKITYPVDGSTIQVGPVYGNAVAETFKEAVRKYSHFTAEATYGDPTFSLQQQSSFLLFHISFDDDVTDNTSMTVTIYNNTTDELRSKTVTTADHQAGFVAAFRNGIALSNAKLVVTDGGSFNDERGITDAILLSNRYYDVTKTFVPMNYFTIQAGDAATTLTMNYTSGLQYRTKSGSTLGSWTSMPSSVSLPASDAIQVRGTGNSAYNTNGPLFSADQPCQIYGDIMSLFCTGISGDNDTRTDALSAPNALQGAFQGLTNIDIPAGRPLFLSAITLSEGCYKQMFAGCTALSRTPDLFNEEENTSAPAIPESACEQMFYGCTALTDASNLPAATVGASGYYRMFYGCTSLVTAPTSLSTTTGSIGDSACEEMFAGCTSLLYSPELPAPTVSADGYRQMFDGCTALVAGPKDLPATTLGDYCYYQMFLNCSDMQTGPASIQAAATEDYCCASMFEGCSKLRETPLIEASGTLATSCFENMFSECSSLRQARNSEFAFTAVGENSCHRMFYKCGALNNAPNMPNVLSVGNYGCKEMYAECSELELNVSPAQQLTAPTATTIGTQGFYQMFYKCRKIKKAPEIYATSMGASACYQMFEGCARMQTPPPSLSATTIGANAYEMMFKGCSALQSTPTFPSGSDASLGNACCRQMFLDCYSLASVSGQLFTANTALTSECYKEMFKNCTALKSVPEDYLPATTLASSCYYSMFNSCSGLKASPELPATTLVSNCYREMFNGCSNLTQVTCLATSGINSGNSTTNWLNGVPNTEENHGTFIKHPSAGVNVSGGWPRSANGIPTYWLVSDGFGLIINPTDPFNPEEPF